MTAELMPWAIALICWILACLMFLRSIKAKRALQDANAEIAALQIKYEVAESALREERQACNAWRFEAVRLEQARRKLVDK